MRIADEEWRTFRLLKEAFCGEGEIPMCAWGGGERSVHRMPEAEHERSEYPFCKRAKMCDTYWAHAENHASQYAFNVDKGDAVVPEREEDTGALGAGFIAMRAPLYLFLRAKSDQNGLFKGGRQDFHALDRPGFPHKSGANPLNY